MYKLLAGCDPMVSEKEGNNAVQYAVICNRCLKPLLEAIKTNNIPCDLNAYNHGKNMIYLYAQHNNRQIEIDNNKKE